MKKFLLVSGLFLHSACSPVETPSKYVCWTEEVNDIETTKLAGGVSGSTLVREICVPLEQYVENDSFASLGPEWNGPSIGSGDSNQNQQGGTDTTAGEGTDTSNGETSSSQSGGIEPDFEESSAGGGEASAVEVNNSNEVEASFASAGNGAAAQEGDQSLSVNASEVRENLRDQIMNR